MKQQRPSKCHSPENGKEHSLADRYYVQQLTAQIVVVRERLSPDGTSGADDRIVRSFAILHDASACARSLNDTAGQHTIN